MTEKRGLYNWSLIVDFGFKLFDSPMTVFVVGHELDGEGRRKVPLFLGLDDGDGANFLRLLTRNVDARRERRQSLDLPDGAGRRRQQTRHFLGRKPRIVVLQFVSLVSVKRKKY